MNTLAKLDIFPQSFMCESIEMWSPASRAENTCFFNRLWWISFINVVFHICLRCVQIGLIVTNIELVNMTSYLFRSNFPATLLQNAFTWMIEPSSVYVQFKLLTETL